MKAIGYIRISDEDQSHYSLDFQKKGVADYCERYGLELVKLFEDNGQSSYTFDRKAFRDLEDAITKEKPQYLIVYNLDRFSRNMAEAMLKVRSLFDIGIRVRDLSEPLELDDSDPNTFLMRSVKFMTAEMELHRIHQRTKSGIRQAALNGRFTSTAPYGYKNNRDGNNKPILEVEEEKAFVVRLIFREYLNGLNLTEIRNIAVTHGFRLTGNSVIRNILANPVYAGLIRVPSSPTSPARLVPGLHIGIITEQDYWQVQEKLNGNHKEQSIQNRDEVPLRGVLHCWCGAKMTAGNSKSRSGKYYWYYLCQNHRQNFSAVQLHGQFQELLNELKLSESSLQAFRDQLAEKVKDWVSNREQQTNDIRKQLDAVELRIEKTERKYLIEDDISEKTYKKVLGELKNDRTRLYQALAKMNTNQQAYFDSLEKVLNMLRDIRLTFKDLSLANKHNFINYVFDKQLGYENGVYRTPNLLPLFKDNLLNLMQKGLLKISSPVINLGKSPLSTPDRSLIEQLDTLAKILTA